MSDETLLIERREGVALLRLNRPQVLNALDEALVRALLAAVEEVRRDDTVRCLLLAGAGRAFCAGGDLRMMLGLDRDRFAEFILSLQRLSAAVRGLDKPSVAALHGYVLAGGFELALLCDIRVASTDTVFGLPDTPLGVSPTSGMTALLPRIVGLGWATHLILTGERIDAAQAERIGLVTRLVSPAELDVAAFALARDLAASPPAALRHARQALDLADERSFAATLNAEREAELACFDTPEFQSNLSAFAARNRPAAPAGPPRAAAD